ncbi:MAG TPA: methyl-coenzyme M reductase family protein [Methanomassiliicoccales archaeon]|nr:methyl-coenzyme M reductase family protein [Methanomassiliicoccales archaeon]
MYEVLMFDGGVHKIDELLDMIEDVGGFVLQRTQVQVMVTLTIAIPAEDRPLIEKKTAELGGKIVEVPLAGTEIAVIGPTLGRHHMPHPICDIAEHLRRYGAITIVMGLARGRGRKTCQISAAEKAIIEEYDAAIFMLGNFKECVTHEKIDLYKDIQIPVVTVVGPELESLPHCEALVCGVGRKVERMRRSEEIAKLEEIADRVKEVIDKRRKEIDEDPLFVHPSEVKDALEGMESVQECLRPAPVVLHVDGLRVKIPYKKHLQELEELVVYGRKLKEIATISDCRLGDSTIIRIKTKAEVEGKVR